MMPPEIEMPSAGNGRSFIEKNASSTINLINQTQKQQDKCIFHLNFLNLFSLNA